LRFFERNIGESERLWLTRPARNVTIHASVQRDPATTTLILRLGSRPPCAHAPPEGHGEELSANRPHSLELHRDVPGRGGCAGSQQHRYSPLPAPKCPFLQCSAAGKAAEPSRAVCSPTQFPLRALVSALCAGCWPLRCAGWLPTAISYPTPRGEYLLLAEGGEVGGSGTQTDTTCNACSFLGILGCEHVGTNPEAAMNCGSIRGS
jgi:hypothetical protein